MMLYSLYSSQLKQETEALSTIYSSQDMTQKQPKHPLTDEWIKKVHIYTHIHTHIGLPTGASGKEPVCQCRRHKRHGFDPWVREIPGGGNGNPLQYSCLENPMDRGVWWAIVHGVSKNHAHMRTCVRTHTHTHTHTHTQEYYSAIKKG